MSTVAVEVADRIALVTIDRSEVRNALSDQVLADLGAALDRPFVATEAFLARRPPEFRGR